MPISDPWLWTLDELVANVCYSDALYLAAGFPAANVPDGAALEKQLRTKQITGRKFLVAFDSSEIVAKNALSIAHISQRMALAGVIKLLRSRSTTYDPQEATLGVRSLDINRDIRLNSDSHHETGRKRRKITPLSTAPLPKRPQAVQNHAAAPGTGPSTEEAPIDTQDWNHLLRWEQEQTTDDIVDFAAEEDLEDVDSEDEDPHDGQDEEDEDLEEVPSRSKLSQEEVVDVINERIEFYTTSWRPNKGVDRGQEVDYDTVRMWEDAEVSGQREALVQKYESEHAYYRQRLDRICDEIVKYPGRNAEQVRRQCNNLEVTIESMELAGWLRDVYKLSPVASNDEAEELHSQEIIDLGSPSASSGMGDVTGDVSDARRRWPTPDSVIAESVETDIAESVEPVIATHPELVPAPTRINHGEEPEHASIGAVRRWLWTDLMEHLDRKRVVSKAISELRADDRELIRNRVWLVGKMASIREIAACVEMLRTGESKLLGVLPRDMPKILIFTNLFLSWWFCRNYFKGPKASKQDLKELKSCIEDGSAETNTFYDYVHTVMGTTFSEDALQHPERPSQAEVIEISDDDD